MWNRDRSNYHPRKVHKSVTWKEAGPPYHANHSFRIEPRIVQLKKTSRRWIIHHQPTAQQEAKDEFHSGSDQGERKSFYSKTRNPAST